jgi:hypothetical protein
LGNRQKVLGLFAADALAISLFLLARTLRRPTQLQARLQPEWVNEHPDSSGRYTTGLRKKQR